jgi:D-3-phosphoglycerate dehydrogenase
MKNKVLITTVIDEKLMQKALGLLRGKAEVRLNPYKRALTEDELITQLKGTDAVFAGGDPFTAGVIDSADGLKVIAKDGVGLDRVDLKAATENGVVVTISPAVCESVADLAFGLLIAVVRKVFTADRCVRAHEWNLRDKFVGRDVHGATLGIIGLGRIGSFMAKRAKAFNMRVLAYDPYVSAEKAKGLGVELLNLENLLKESDVVTIHAPLTEETRELIGEGEFNAMKRGAFLINVARGAIIDEKALYRALTTGRLAGAGLDVLTVEPPLPDNPFLKLENVILTPHMGNETPETLESLSMEAATDIIRVLEGRRPFYPANPEVLEKLNLT